MTSVCLLLACFAQLDAESQVDRQTYQAMGETFDYLLEIALDAYIKHFDGDPSGLSAVHYYYGLFERRRQNGDAAREHFRTAVELGGQGEFAGRSRCWLYPAENHSDYPWEWIRANPHALRPEGDVEVSGRDLVNRAILAVREQDSESLRRLREEIACAPQLVLQRSGEDGGANCQFYDPKLFDLYAPPSNSAAGPQPSIGQLHQEITRLRNTPAQSELSMRRFLEANQALIWQLARQYQSQALRLQLDGKPQLARYSLLRTLALGEALFPPAKRGRLDSLAPVFLVELGSVYAHLERYGDMLRYIYYPEGLPQIYPAATIVMELATVAEAVHLLKPDSGDPEEQLPETLAQILFDKPFVVELADASPASSPDRSPDRYGLAWVLMSCGIVLLSILIAVRLLAGRSVSQA